MARLPVDVAVVVATPVALQAARRHGIGAGRLAAAVAITANAASFLLPTSNTTSLLLLGRADLPAIPAGRVAGVVTGIALAGRGARATGWR